MIELFELGEMEDVTHDSKKYERVMYTGDKKQRLQVH